jgi:hypothetical protein
LRKPPARRGIDGRELKTIYAFTPRTQCPKTFSPVEYHWRGGRRAEIIGAVKRAGVFNFSVAGSTHPIASPDIYRRAETPG